MNGFMTKHAYLPIMLFAIFNPVFALRSFPAAKNSMNSKDLELNRGSGLLTATNSVSSHRTNKSVISR